MFETDGMITSSCRLCQAPIDITTANAGRIAVSAKPDDAVVWYDLAYAEAAATSCCPSIGFFCSDGHLQQWLATRKPPRAGCRRTLAEAMEVGRAIFEPVLATPCEGCRRHPLGSLDRQEAGVEYAPDPDCYPGAPDCRYPDRLSAVLGYLGCYRLS
jgi:hypothetical protein